MPSDLNSRLVSSLSRVQGSSDTGHVAETALLYTPLRGLVVPLSHNAWQKFLVLKVQVEDLYLGAGGITRLHVLHYWDVPNSRSFRSCHSRTWIVKSWLKRRLLRHLPGRLELPPLQGAATLTLLS